ncbi:MAG: DNA-binding response regulator, partial [Mesorhizobium sp.]
MLVMIAENDGLHRTFARRTVEQLWPGDVEVIEAGDGEDAINLAAERQP